MIEEAPFKFVHGQEEGQIALLSLDFMQAACSNSRSSSLNMLNETSYMEL